MLLPLISLYFAKVLDLAKLTTLIIIRWRELVARASKEAEAASRINTLQK